MSDDGRRADLDQVADGDTEDATAGTGRQGSFDEVGDEANEFELTSDEASEPTGEFVPELADETAAELPADETAREGGGEPGSEDEPGTEEERAPALEPDTLPEPSPASMEWDAPLPEPPPELEVARVGPPTTWPEPLMVVQPEVEPRWFQAITVTPSLVVLSLLMTLIFLMFVGIEPTPRWLLLFAAVVAVLGTEGVLREGWPRVFVRPGGGTDSTPFLFLPALAAIATPLLIEHNIRGYWVIPAALVAGLGYAAVIAGQVSSVRVAGPAYPAARMVSTAAVYFTAFALLSMGYVLELGTATSVIAAAIVGSMLSVELFREGQVDPAETLVFAGVTGFILAEARWAMHFIPVGGYLGGLSLLLVLFLVTGLLHSHLTRHLNRLVAIEYAGLAAAGVTLVTIASQAGLG